MTLKDVYHILRLPIRGERIVYDPQHSYQTFTAYYHDQGAGLGIEGYEIRWEFMVEHYGRFDALLVT